VNALPLTQVLRQTGRSANLELCASIQVQCWLAVLCFYFPPERKAPKRHAFDKLLQSKKCNWQLPKLTTDYCSPPSGPGWTAWPAKPPFRACMGAFTTAATARPARTTPLPPLSAVATAANWGIVRFEQRHKKTFW
jgi:hypothetical protein